MPLHFCHPNMPYRKLRMPEWFVSSVIMDRRSNHATHFVARPLLFGARRDRPFPAALMRMWPISTGHKPENDNPDRY